ncbi:hypothetical protein NQZ68_007707 [Dissostichus eleginoides]|nr:hypothetical protein NQZ68_007707 [Dissostichus eleginoides]
MKQCLRIALWMVILTGCLQAKPVTPGPNTTKTPWSFNFNDLVLGKLGDVNEHQKNSFPSLNGMNMTANRLEALKCCIEGLEYANESCTNQNGRIDDTLDALKIGSGNALHKGSKNTTCERPKTSNFEDFVKTIETFVQSVNNGQLPRK